MSQSIENIRSHRSPVLTAFFYPGQGYLPNGTLDASLNGEYADILEPMHKTAGIDPSKADMSSKHITHSPEASQVLSVGISLVGRRAVELAGVQKPDVALMASLGEWTGLIDAGVEPKQIIAGVKERGRASRVCMEYFETAEIPGGMYACIQTRRTKLEDGEDFSSHIARKVEQANQALAEKQQRRKKPPVTSEAPLVEHLGAVSGYNHPGQVTVSGSQVFLNTFISLFNREAGIKFKKLDIEFAYHSPYMTAAETAVKNFLRSQKMPEIDGTTTIISSTSGREITTVAEYKTDLANAMTRPVLLRQALETFGSAVASNECIDDVVIFEFGPPQNADDNTSQGVNISNISRTFELDSDYLMHDKETGRRVRFTLCRVGNPADIGTPAVRRALATIDRQLVPIGS